MPAAGREARESADFGLEKLIYVGESGGHYCQHL